MLSVRHFPNLATAALWDWLRPFAKYDADGRASRQLSAGVEPLAPGLESVARAVCPEAKPGEWESVLVQCYRDGSAVTPCHSDLTSTGFGFILSLGAARTFRVHRTERDSCIDYDVSPTLIECVNGTAVIMDEEFHRRHHHQIVPDAGAGERMGLVFRTRPRG